MIKKYECLEVNSNSTLTSSETYVLTLYKRSTGEKTIIKLEETEQIREEK